MFHLDGSSSERRAATNPKIKAMKETKQAKTEKTSATNKLKAITSFTRSRNFPLEFHRGRTLTALSTWNDPNFAGRRLTAKSQLAAVITIASHDRIRKCISRSNPEVISKIRAVGANSRTSSWGLASLATASGSSARTTQTPLSRETILRKRSATTLGSVPTLARVSIELKWISVVNPSTIPKPCYENAFGVNGLLAQKYSYAFMNGQIFERLDQRQ